MKKKDSAKELLKEILETYDKYGDVAWIDVIERIRKVVDEKELKMIPKQKKIAEEAYKKMQTTIKFNKELERLGLSVKAKKSE